MLECPAVEVKSEEKGNFVSLQIFLRAIEFSIVLEEIDGEFETAASIGSIEDGQNVVEEKRICHFDCKQHEYLDFLEVGKHQFVLRNVDYKLAEEVEIEFGCDLFINSFVDVVVLVGWLALAPLKMLVELVYVFEQQMEQFLTRVGDHSDRFESFRQRSALEGCPSDEHTL